MYFLWGVPPPIVTWDDPPPTHSGKGCLPGLSLRLPSCLSRLPKFAKPIFMGGYPPSRGDPITSERDVSDVDDTHTGSDKDV